MRLLLAALFLLAAAPVAAQDARVPDMPLSLDPSTCPAELDADVLAGHVVLEAPVALVASSLATVHATFGEPPCLPSRVRVALRDQGGVALVGPVELSTEGLSPRLTARVVALWIGEAVRSLPPPVPAPAVASATPLLAAVATRPTAPPPPPQPLLQFGAMAGVGYAPYTTSRIVGGAVILAIPMAMLQLDLGFWPTFTPFNLDLGQFTGGLAMLVPFVLTPSISLELGVRVTCSYVVILSGSGTAASTGDQLLGGGGGIVRGVLRNGSIRTFVEVEVGAPFASFQVHESGFGLPPNDITVFDSVRVDGRVGVTFE